MINGIPQLKKIIMWALTYRCNMSCEYCYLHDNIHNWSELSSEEIIRLANQIANNEQWKPNAVWLTGGEPTIIDCLPEVVRILEETSIKSVITTNGYCSPGVLSDIMQSKPRGITVSLDSFNITTNEKVRGFTKDVIKNVGVIAQNKDPYTILGVSSVFTPDRIPALFSFAERLKEIGVEYLSLNPIVGKGKLYKKEDFDLLNTTLLEIKEKIGLRIPSSFYISLVKDYYLSEGNMLLKCPAGSYYFFISPWGEWLPCSNEIWQGKQTMANDKGIKGVKDSLDYDAIKTFLKAEYHVDEIFTNGMCFNDRCIGCWKLYYDTIFT